MSKPACAVEVVSPFIFLINGTFLYFSVYAEALDHPTVPTRLFWDFRFLFFQSVKPSVSPLLTRGFAGRGRFVAGVRLFLVFVGAFFAIG